MKPYNLKLERSQDIGAKEEKQIPALLSVPQHSQFGLDVAWDSGTKDVNPQVDDTMSFQNL